MVIRLACLGLTLMMLTGCISIDYVGQSYGELKPDERVVWYESAQDVPPNTYQVVGRATATAPDGYSGAEVKDALIAEARVRGINAIQVVSSGSVVLQRSSVADNGTPGFGVDWIPREGQWTPYNSFGQPSVRQVRQVEIREFQAKVLFMVFKPKYDEAMKKFTEERRSLIETAAPEKTPESPVKIKVENTSDTVKGSK